MAMPLTSSLRHDVEDLYRSLGTWRMWRTLAATAIGAMVFCIAINGILIPNKFIAGSVTGISLLLFYIIKVVPLNVIFWLINIPILILGWRTMSLRYVFISLVGVFMTGLGLELTQDIRIPTTDPILAAILSGLISGTGVGFYLRVGGSTGGMDIVATVIRKKFGIPMSTTFMTVNIINVTVGGLLNNLDIALYTGISMYVYGFVLERVQSGFSQRKSLFIITARPDEVAHEIVHKLNRGVTFFNASSGYEKEPLRVVYTVLNMVELGRMKEILFRVDSQAFVTISDTAQVIGNRFVSWEEEGFEHRKQRG